MLFDLLSLQKVVVMTFLFWTRGVFSKNLERNGPKSHFFNKGSKSQHFKT